MYTYKIRSIQYNPQASITITTSKIVKATIHLIDSIYCGLAVQLLNKCKGYTCITSNIFENPFIIYEEWLLMVPKINNFEKNKKLGHLFPTSLNLSFVTCTTILGKKFVTKANSRRYASCTR